MAGWGWRGLSGIGEVMYKKVRNAYAMQRDICAEMKSLVCHIIYAKSMDKDFKNSCIASVYESGLEQRQRRYSRRIAARAFPGRSTLYS